MERQSCLERGEHMSSILSLLMNHLDAVCVAIIDAVLLLVPSLKSNNVLQLIGNVAKAIGDAIKNVVQPPAA